MVEESEAQPEAPGEEEIFKNNHDLIGIDGIIRSQRAEIEMKKLELRMENEKYFR